MKCPLCGSPLEEEYYTSYSKSFHCTKNKVTYLNESGGEYAIVITMEKVGDDSFIEYYYSSGSEICIEEDSTTVFFFGQICFTFQRRLELGEIKNYLYRAERVAPFI